jgi:hypothetical protein
MQATGMGEVTCTLNPGREDLGASHTHTHTHTHSHSHTHTLTHSHTHTHSHSHTQGSISQSQPERLLFAWHEDTADRTKVGSLVLTLVNANT